jgi:uncharacterized membrane protein YccC
MTSDSAVTTRIARFFRQSAISLRDELKQLRLTGPRALLCAETVCSVVLAVLLADLFGLKDRWWVAISAYVVVRGSLKVSLWRCIDRIAGTLAGATLSALSISLLPHSELLFALLLALFAGFGLYRAIGSPRSYAWTLGTVTSLLVLSEAHQLTGLKVYELALRRVCDVATGISASMLVIATAYFAHTMWRSRQAHDDDDATTDTALAFAAPAQITGALDRHNWAMRKLRAMQGLQGAITIGVLGLFAYHHELPFFPQTLISIAAVLQVPLPSLLRKKGEDDLVSLRMANRALGCMAAALIAVVMLPFIGNIPWLCMTTLAAGVWLAAHVQAGSAATSYLGTQFGIGFILTFVQDQRWSTDASAPALRLVGILTGLSALTLVMFVMHRVRLWLISNSDDA